MVENRIRYTHALLITALVLAAPGVASAQSRSRAGQAADTRSTGQDLRQVNWASVLAHDGHLTHLGTGDDVGKPDGAEPYVAVADVQGSGPEDVGGYPLTRQIQYGDLSGDGHLEAAIPLASGGTAGVVGVLVYAQGRAAADPPTLVAALAGYKMGIRIQNQRLWLTEPVYVGWEPNCCPSGSSEFQYTFRRGKLTVQGSRETGWTGAIEQTVDRFYTLLGAKEFTAAYELLGPTFKATQPFDKWQAGYAGLSSVSSAVTSDPEKSPSWVTVEVRATNAGKKQHFVVRWLTRYSRAGHHWLLDWPSVTVLN